MTVILCHLLLCPFWLSRSCQSLRCQILGARPTHQRRGGGGCGVCDTTLRQRSTICSFVQTVCACKADAASLFSFTDGNRLTLSTLGRCGWMWTYCRDCHIFSQNENQIQQSSGLTESTSVEEQRIRSKFWWNLSSPCCQFVPLDGEIHPAVHGESFSQRWVSVDKQVPLPSQRGKIS